MYEDVQTRWQYFNVGTKKSDEKRLQRLWHGSRDSARTPVQWSAEENAGFTTGKPWFYVNENYVDVNVAAQEAVPSSVLNFYRHVIQLRKRLSCVRYGDYKEYGKASPSLYTYSREDEKEKLLVVCSFTEKVKNWRAPVGFDLATAELLACNYDKPQRAMLQPYETRVYRWKK
jgi:oligo-1,6-glucosidase